jgi:glycosyltransferase involved in cell wall biosynthesis
LRRVDAVIAVSRPLVAVLAAKRIPRDRIVLIPNAFAPRGDGLDRAAARRALGIDEERRALGWVGRLSREKGADVLIDSLARVSAPRPMVVFVGDGPERESLVRQCESLGLLNDVRFVGAVQNAARLYAAFDGFVLSSRSEGTPMCLFEAMESGAPLVVTKVGGVPDVVSEKEALVVPPEDPPALAAAIRTLIGDGISAETRAIAARQRLRSEFNLEVWLARHHELYRRLAADQRRGRTLDAAG